MRMADIPAGKPAKKPAKVRTSRPISALLLGLLATAAVVLVHRAGLDSRAELPALDWRIRHFSAAPPLTDLLHVDIDDRSLEQLGRWPWPREQLGGVVELLAACGARMVVLDIILPWPQNPRYVSAVADVYKADDSPLTGAGRPQLVFDDAALTDAIRQAGNVFVPMHIDLAPGGTPSQPPPALAAMTKVLTAQPGLDLDQAAAQARLSPAEAEQVVRAARQTAIEARVTQALAARPDTSLKEIRAAILPNLAENVQGLEQDLLTRAYLRCRALRELERFAIAPSRIDGYPAPSGALAPPLVLIAQQCLASGFVTVQPDRQDGVVRHIPMLAGGAGKLYGQFALSLAAWDLAGKCPPTTQPAPAAPEGKVRPAAPAGKGGKPAARAGASAQAEAPATTTATAPAAGSFDITADRSAVTIALPDGQRRVIPVDDRGRLLINWTADDPRRHISAAMAGEIWLQRQRIAKNKALIRLHQLKWAEAMKAENMLRLFPSDKDYEDLIQAQTALQQARLFDPVSAGAAGLEDEIRRLGEQDARNEKNLDGLLKDIFDDFFLQGASDKERIQTLQTRLAISQLQAANAEIQGQIGADLALLRQKVAGKVCLVGSTSTGAADFVISPLGVQTPGAVVHANIFNTIVSGSFIRPAPPWLDIVAIAAAGAVISLLAATCPVMLVAGPAMIVLGGAYVAFNALLAFGQWNVWLVVAGPLGAMVGSFLIVSAFRQLTEERAKRHIRGMFAHALSPALVDRLIEDPSLARLGGEKRVLSCMFSDIAGFTTLSERLGEHATVQLLNRYFDRMTAVIQDRHGGYLNKFLGDGIFAFFGAPVPQDDHPRRALAAALDCRQELLALNEQLAAEAPGAAALDCRIGITTGEVMVGNCGSTQRMDYTAIGDTVNLASRLEGANKFFGTRILAAEESLPRRHDDEFFARPLGRILVVGKNEPVSVWNLLCRAEQAPAEQVQAAADFAHALDLFFHQEFSQAARTFQAILDRLGEDKPAQIYLDLCRQYEADPPPADWNGAVKLTEK